MSVADIIQASPGRIRNRKILNGSPSYAKMNGGLRVEVTLIGGQKLEFSVGARLLTQDLVALVASHYALQDAQYFSLAFRNNSGEYQWLSENLRLIDHEFVKGVKVLPLSFLVRYFPESITELRDPQAVEIFYHNAKDIVSKGSFDIKRDTLCRLAALTLHISHGDFLDKATIRVLLNKSPLLPPSVREEFQVLDTCLNIVNGHFTLLKGVTRGEAILQYMKEIEAVPEYGVHFYEVKDRSNNINWLGISRSGICEYGSSNKKDSTNTFFWQQLENLYIRERRFSIEVHDPAKPVVARRGFWPGKLRVYSWFTESQNLCKEIWSMAIAQHQFFLDRRSLKVKDGNLRDSFDLAGELSKSYLSLSAQSSPSISRSGSHSSIHHSSIADDSVSTESLQAARKELVAALQQRYDALRNKLESKTEELKILCQREGELTGVLPQEFPLKPGEPPPTIRKRIGTSFTIEESLINKIINKQEEAVSTLELEYEMQAKIATAALRLANESSLRKGLRRQRKQSYHQALSKLKDIERKLKLAKSKQTQAQTSGAALPKVKKKPRPLSESEALDDTQVSEYKDTSILNNTSMSTSRLPPSHDHKKKIQMAGPPSPLIGSNANGESTVDGSHVASPGRPVSGYIPSGVTRSQYRTQHFPTLSTRGQSVPLEVAGRTVPFDVANQEQFSRAVFNIPKQRGSIVAHSLDDMDASVKSPIYANTPNQYQFHHHHYNHHQSGRSPNTSQERYGSLDRRRSGSGRYESRSLEQLNETPNPNQSTDHNTPQSKCNTSFVSDCNVSMSRQNEIVHPNPHDRIKSISTYPSPASPAEANPFPKLYSPYANASEFTDIVDGSKSTARSQYNHVENGADFSRLNSEAGLSTVHRIVRTPSGRSYMETTFSGDTSFDVPSPNQENIPPTPHRPMKSEGKPSLRATSINAADHLRPSRTPVTDLPPLRATKSTLDLPPLKPTNKEIRPQLRLPHTPSQNEEPLLSLAEAARMKKENKLWTEQDVDMKVHPRQRNTSSIDININNYNGTHKEIIAPPREFLATSREYTEPTEMIPKECLPPPKQYSSTPKELSISIDHTPTPREFKDQLMCHMPQKEYTGTPRLLHNASTSSISSSSSGSSVLLKEDSLNATLTVDSPGNHMIINPGTFQPSREISKPFEMADFYKYSTKYRKHSPTAKEVPVQNVSPSMQKGVYQPPTPMTCQPISEHSPNQSWEGTQMHQAVPATVTNKRAATLV